MTSGQEMERVHSYNPGACTGRHRSGHCPEQHCLHHPRPAPILDGVGKACWTLSYNWGASSNEKLLGETQTLCAGCSKVEPKNFAPPQTPSRGARDG